MSKSYILDNVPILWLPQARERGYHCPLVSVVEGRSLHPTRVVHGREFPLNRKWVGEENIYIYREREREI